MKKFTAVLCVALSFMLASCGKSFKAEKEALVGTKWFSAKDTSNSIVVWNFNEDSVEKASYYIDDNGIHNSGKEAAEYKIQKDAIEVDLDTEKVLIPYSFENGKIMLKKGEYFSPDDIKAELQGFWHLRKSSVLFGEVSTHEYNVQFENDTMRIENAADARGGAPGEYYYYGPYESTYTIGDGIFETEIDEAAQYFFNVYEGKVNLFHYGSQMSEGTGFPGENGYIFD